MHSPSPWRTCGHLKAGRHTLEPKSAGTPESPEPELTKTKEPDTRCPPWEGLGTARHPRPALVSQVCPRQDPRLPRTGGGLSGQAAANSDPGIEGPGDAEAERTSSLPEGFNFFYFKTSKPFFEGPRVELQPDAPVCTDNDKAGSCPSRDRHAAPALTRLAVLSESSLCPPLRTRISCLSCSQSLQPEAHPRGQPVAWTQSTVQGKHRR